MTEAKSVSPLRLRFRRFRRIRRGYYSFLLLAGAYLASFLLAFLMNNKAVMVRYEGRTYFPAFRNYFHDTFGFGRERVYAGAEFGQRNENGEPLQSEAEYRRLKTELADAGEGNFAILPPIPYHPNEGFLEMEGTPPHAPSREHWMGTDDRARDVFVRLVYGFRISISFALIVTLFAYTFGVLIGAILGYYGRWCDFLGQRVVEIWGAIPFLYTVIILASLFGRSFLLLVGIITAFSWMAITYYIRGEFYREKSRDYVAAAIANGESNWMIMTRHILPNALTPIIAFAPFSIVAEIVSLVSLDFLNLGLLPPTPSWGELLHQAKQNLRVWHLVVFPLGAMFVTLQLVVFIGESVREAFDPRVFSRLR